MKTPIYIILTLSILLMGCNTPESGKEVSEKSKEEIYSEEYEKCISLNDSALMIQMDNPIFGNTEEFNDSIYKICSALYNEAIQCDSNLLSAWTNKTILISEREKYEDGIIHLQAMKKQFPEMIMITAQLGIFHKELEQMDIAHIHLKKSWEHYDSLYQIDQSPSTLSDLLGITLHFKGTDEARTLLEQNRKEIDEALYNTMQKVIEMEESKNPYLKP